VRRDAEAEAIAERFRAAIERLAEPHDASALGIVTLSVGSAVSRAAPALKVSAWLAAADDALYRSNEL
jgi:GGDEF domain-containing protein